MPRPNPLMEMTAGSEYFALQTSAVIRGEGVPKGDGKSVLVLPGLFANDLYLNTIRRWLKRIGYDPIASTIPLNVGCPNRLLDIALEALIKAKPAGEIAIIGHSRGGMLAKAVTSRLSPDRVTHLIAVGSPLGGLLAAGPGGMAAFADAMERSESAGTQFVANAGKNMTRMLNPDCKAPVCDCAYYQAVFAPLADSVKVTSIFSESDPIVPAIMSALPFGTNVSIDGTHSGLMFNAKVFQLIGEALAQ